MYKQIEIILILQKFLSNTFGFYYPVDIIYFIVLIYRICTKIRTSCGCNHTVLIKNHVYTWGQNDFGQLGLKHYDNIFAPQKLMFDNIRKVKCGDSCTILMTQSGEIYKSGDISRLGPRQNKYKKIVNVDKIIKMTCTSTHIIVLTIRNELYTWGSNICGQLGLGDYYNYDTPQKLNLTKIRSVWCGSHHTIALSKENNIFVWGFNSTGQLGLGDYNKYNVPMKLFFKDVLTVGCGSTHTIALLKDGKIFVWGNNFNGQLGLGALSVSGRHTSTVTTPRELFLNDVVSVKCGYHFTIFLIKQGDLFGCGHNVYGELGLGMMIL